MSEKKAGITLRYEVDPEAVCCGVMIDDGDGKRLVRVTSKDEYVVPDSNASLWEYADENGRVRACLLRVDDGKDSPIWHINSDAGEDVGAPYYEVHQTVAGAGEFAIDEGPNAKFGYPVTYHPLGTINMLGGVCVAAGQGFAIEAAPTLSGSDSWVLATFPGAPFQPHYETRML